MSKAIPGPKRTADISDRQICCEESLEAAYQELVRRAELAGWQTLEVTVALQSLADHHMLAAGANGETDRLLAEVLRLHRR